LSLIDFAPTAAPAPPAIAVAISENPIPVLLRLDCKSSIPFLRVVKMFFKVLSIPD
jgi:hypothetical protein